jgi:hypothetical protein
MYPQTKPWRIALVLWLILLGLGALLPATTQAAERQRCFRETGYCVRGAILDYWERNGGLPVFGYPISEPRIETVEGSWIGLVQWFERDRLEDHGSEGVLAGRLGAWLLEWQGRPWEIWPTQPPEAAPGCRYFAVTGHTLCEPFLSYWERNGGLSRFGYPITEPTTEESEGWTGRAQYFERRRMEHHPELAGTPYEVLLGLLGRTVRDVETLATCPHPLYAPWKLAYTRVGFGGELGCPESTLRDIPAAIQSFEGGQMIWVDRGASGRVIYTLFFDAGGSVRGYQGFMDEWDERQPASGSLRPPAGLLEPERGFGKVWRENAEVRERLGWATTPEKAGRADVQDWRGGVMLWLALQSDSGGRPIGWNTGVYALAFDGRAVAVTAA